MKSAKLLKLLYVQVLIGLVLGIAVGHWWPEFGASLKPLGDGFVKLVKMMIAPIVFCTIVSGITSLNDSKQIGKTLLKSMGLFYVLTILAIITRHADLFFVLMAWVFVVLRIFHAYVHLTSNVLQIRGPLFSAGLVVLSIMWIVFIARIMLGLP